MLIPKKADAWQDLHNENHTMKKKRVSLGMLNFSQAKEISSADICLDAQC